jgi:cobalt-zinc-cadmium efflux system membrane fusion protein
MTESRPLFLESSSRPVRPYASRWTLIAAAGLASLLSGCGRTAIQASEPAPAPANADPLEITANADLLKRLKTGQPVMAAVGASMEVAARIEVDETRVTRVGSPVMGRITELAVREGEPVKKGQLIASLSSTGLSAAQLDLLKDLSQANLARRAVERAEILLKADVIGSAELQRREAELAQATAELAAARDELALLGMPPEAIAELERTRKINSVSPIVAGMEGTVLSRKVTIGQVVQPADTVVEVADLSQVWLVADVPEENAAKLRAGYEVEAEIAALPGETIQGKLSFVSATVNPDTRTVRVRMDLPNPVQKYKPAMLATMVLKDQREQKLVIPTTAVVRENDLDHVFVRLDGDTFVLRQVELGDEVGGRRILLNGIRAGETIVVDGAFHLNNERKRLAIQG